MMHDVLGGQDGDCTSHEPALFVHWPLMHTRPSQHPFAKEQPSPDRRHIGGGGNTPHTPDERHVSPLQHEPSVQASPLAPQAGAGAQRPETQ